MFGKVKIVKMKSAPATFKDFFKVADFCYSSVGMNLLKGENVSKIKNNVNNFILLIVVVNISYIAVLELSFMFVASRDANSFVDIVMTLSLISHGMVGCFKIVFLWSKRFVLSRFLHQLKHIFPVEPKHQMECNVFLQLRQCSRITMAIAFINFFSCWNYNLYPISNYFVRTKFLNDQSLKKSLPYPLYLPFNHTDHWSFAILYVSQNMGAFHSTAGQILTDLLLCGSATQLIMHYDFLAKTLQNFKSAKPQNLANKQKAFEDDKAFLSKMIKYHVYLLDLSNQINSIFGVPLLLNFFASSFVICFVGFQITMGSSIENLSKLFLFMLICLIQIYLICHFGQQLNDSSTSVAAAVYNMDWYTIDIRIKKMLVFVALRAQKPAQLEATCLVTISKATWTQIMQISYQLFTFLRTMYAED